MKKIFFAAIAALSISFTSCTNDAIEENTNTENISIQHSEMLLTKTIVDTTGGQGGNTPPPPPPVTPQLK
jgi:hypothetical protein